MNPGQLTRVTTASSQSLKEASSRALKLYRNVLKATPKVKTVFDVGAHKGEFASNILNYSKYLKIYAFEPQSEIYLELKRRFRQSTNIFINACRF